MASSGSWHPFNDLPETKSRWCTQIRQHTFHLCISLQWCCATCGCKPLQKAECKRRRKARSGALWLPLSKWFWEIWDQSDLLIYPTKTLLKPWLFFPCVNAECAEVIFLHAAIILVTQYEIGLAQGALCGLPIWVTRGNIGSSCDCFDWVRWINTHLQQGITLN